MTDKAREAAAGAMTATMKNAADKIYWWDGADAEKVSGGEPEWEEYGPGVMLADRFDMQAIANAAIDAYLAAQWQPIESAPRDGTRILMWDNAAWTAQAFCRDGKFVGWDADSHFLSLPTHWMPITPPPETT